MSKALDYLKVLNIDYLVRRLVENEDWEEDEAKNATRRYKNFLVLIYKYPDHFFPPPYDIDEVWHAHILHTRKYTEDCENIFGKYLHHTPASKDPEEQETLRIEGELASELYMKEFQEIYQPFLDVNSFW